MVDQMRFREAMSRLAAAVNIVTTDGAAGRHGFTASAVCSVTADPPTLLVCMNRSLRAYESFAQNGVLAVNVLPGSDQDLSALFAGGAREMVERFASGKWRTLSTGSPILESAAVSFDCRISEMKDVGSHAVLFCEVLDAAWSTVPEALVYFRRGYHHLIDQPEA